LLVGSGELGLVVLLTIITISYYYFRHMATTDVETIAIFPTVHCRHNRAHPECDRIVNNEWWMVDGGWWMVDGEWWMMDGGWWIINDG